MSKESDYCPNCGEVADGGAFGGNRLVKCLECGNYRQDKIRII